MTHVIRLTPAHYLSLFFKPTTRSNWDLVTPVALLGLSILGVTFIYSAVLQSPLHHKDWIKQLVYLDAAMLQGGQSVFSLLPSEIVEARKKAAQDTSGGLSIPPPPAASRR